MKRFASLLTMLLAFALLYGCGGSSGDDSSAPTPTTVNSFGVMSDPHYYDTALGTNGTAYEAYVAGDRKLLSDSPAILESAIDLFIAKKPAFVLIPGDLTKDGERSGHQKFADAIKRLEDNGIQTYVICGNHDINNADAVQFSGATKTQVATVTPVEFTTIYAKYGYDQALARDSNSLSYVADLPGAGNLRLIAIDSCLYDKNTPTDPITAGKINDATRAWVMEQIANGKASGKTVIGMMHHGILEHYDGQSTEFPEYVVADWKDLSRQFAAAGMQTVFTGHYHAQDIVTDSVIGMTDVETGSLVTYPSPLRIVEVQDAGGVASFKYSSMNVTSITVPDSSSSHASLAYNGSTTFPAYSEKFLDDGLYNLALAQLVHVYGQDGSLDSTKQLAKALAEALKAHYVGDETPDSDTQNYYKALQANSSTAFFGKYLQALWTDLAPHDTDISDKAAKPMGSAFHLTLMHVNDVHSHLEASSNSISPNKIKTYVSMGGFPRLATKVKQIRTNSDNSLLLHAGDAIMGTLYFTVFNGTADFTMMNDMKFDAMAAGNHEFDRGPALFADLITIANFPVLGSNIDASADANLNGKLKNYVIKELNGQRVGIFGLTTPTTSNLSSPGANVKFNDPIATAKAIVAELQARDINKIICLSHLGYDEEKDLAGKVDGIDIIIGGHSHTTMGALSSLGITADGTYPVKTTSPNGDPVYLVSAGDYARILGIASLYFDAHGKIVKFSGMPTLLLGDDFLDGDKNAVNATRRAQIMHVLYTTPDAEVVAEDSATGAVLKTYADQVETMKSTVIAQAGEDIPHTRVPLTDKLSYGSPSDFPNGSFLAPIVAEGMYVKAKEIGQNPHLAIQNAGGVRVSLLKGDVTIGVAHTILPFANMLYMVELTGKEVWDALEGGVDTAVNGTSSGAFPYLGNARMAVNNGNPAGSKITSIEIKDASGNWVAVPKDDTSKYNVATNNYIAGGGDFYDTLKNAAGSRVDTGIVDADILIDYFKSLGTVSRMAGGFTSVTWTAAP